MKTKKVKTIDIGNTSSREAEQIISKYTGKKQKNSFLEFFMWFFAFWN